MSIQLPEHSRSKNKKSRSDTTQLHAKPRSVRTPKIPMNTTTPLSEIEELKSAKEASTPQRMVSVVRHSKTRLDIDSGASIHILFNKELLGGLVNLNVPLKIQPSAITNCASTSSITTSTTSNECILLSLNKQALTYYKS